MVKARDKLSCYSTYSSQKDLKAPNSIISNNSLMYKELLKRFNGEEIVVKLLNGTHGIGVLTRRQPSGRLNQLWKLLIKESSRL